MDSKEEMRGMKRAMHNIAFSLPVAIVLAGSINLWIFDFYKNLLYGEAFLFVASCLLARFLYRRSKNLEATFFYVRVSPSDDEGKTFSTECAAIIVAVGFVLVSIFEPYVRL
jgi:hypothetical protein